MLKAKTRDEIAAMVRSGFCDRQQVIDLFTEEIYEPGELDLTDVTECVDTCFAAYEEEKKAFPDVTDCDRLDQAFQAINERGVVALQNAGYTQSDGFQDVGEVYNQHPNQESVLGYCFYHGQDLERAVNGQGLFFAFGPVDPADEQTVGVEVGNIIREELERTGLKVEWDGTFESRLRIPEIKWQKR